MLKSKIHLRNHILKWGLTYILHKMEPARFL